MADKKYNFFESYHRALSRVSDERYGRVVRAMSEYVFAGLNPSFDDDADCIVWELIQPILERGQEITAARAEAGRVGGLNGKGVSRNLANTHACKSKSKAKQKQNKSGIGEGIGEGNGIFCSDEKEKISFSFVSSDFSEIFETWLKYKRGRGEAYTPEQAKAFYSRLKQLSCGDPAKARQIVEQAMTGNYPNIVQLAHDHSDYYANHRPTPAENIRAAQEAHLRDLAEFINNSKQPTPTEEDEILPSNLPF